MRVLSAIAEVLPRAGVRSDRPDGAETSRGTFGDLVGTGEARPARGGAGPAAPSPPGSGPGGSAGAGPPSQVGTAPTAPPGHDGPTRGSGSGARAPVSLPTSDGRAGQGAPATPADETATRTPGPTPPGDPAAGSGEPSLPRIPVANGEGVTGTSLLVGLETPGGGPDRASAPALPATGSAPIATGIGTDPLGENEIAPGAPTRPGGPLGRPFPAPGRAPAAPSSPADGRTPAVPATPEIRPVAPDPSAAREGRPSFAAGLVPGAGGAASATGVGVPAVGGGPGVPSTPTAPAVPATEDAGAPGRPDVAGERDALRLPVGPGDATSAPAGHDAPSRGPGQQGPPAPVGPGGTSHGSGIRIATPTTGSDPAQAGLPAQSGASSALGGDGDAPVSQRIEPGVAGPDRGRGRIDGPRDPGGNHHDRAAVRPATEPAPGRTSPHPVHGDPAAGSGRAHDGAPGAALASGEKEIEPAKRAPLAGGIGRATSHGPIARPASGAAPAPAHDLTPSGGQPAVATAASGDAVQPEGVSAPIRSGVAVAPNALAAPHLTTERFGAAEWSTGAAPTDASVVAPETDVVREPWRALPADAVRHEAQRIVAAAMAAARSATSPGPAGRNGGATAPTSVDAAAASVGSATETVDLAHPATGLAPAGGFVTWPAAGLGPGGSGLTAADSAMPQSVGASNGTAAAAPYPVDADAAWPTGETSVAMPSGDGSLVAAGLAIESHAPDGPFAAGAPRAVDAAQTAVGVADRIAPAGGGGRVSIAAPSSGQALPPDVRQAVLEQVTARLAKLAPGRTVAIALDPPELGRVVVRFVRQDAQWVVRLAAERPDVAQALARDMGQLESLLQRGDEPMRVEVSVSQDGGPSGSHDGRSLDGQHAQRRDGESTHARNARRDAERDEARDGRPFASGSRLHGGRSILDVLT